jgi:hypothetical protein
VTEGDEIVIEYDEQARPFTALMPKKVYKRE